MTSYFYSPEECHRLPHDPFNAIVGPHPIDRIGTLSSVGVRNLAPYSFFNAFSYTPPLIGELTWDLATRRLAEQMNATSTTADVDEFVDSGLEATDSVDIGGPRVAASPVSFECRVSDVIALRGADGRTSPGVLTIGEVVAVHIDETLIPEGIYQKALTQPMLREADPLDGAWDVIAVAKAFTHSG